MTWASDGVLDDLEEGHIHFDQFRRTLAATPLLGNPHGTLAVDSFSVQSSLSRISHLSPKTNVFLIEIEQLPHLVPVFSQTLENIISIARHENTVIRKARQSNLPPTQRGDKYLHEILSKKQEMNF